MKSKRFLAMLLAVMMMLTAALSTGCSKKESNEQNEKSGIVTLNMFIITDEKTSDSAKLEVQWNINAITVPQHKMLVKINYVTADEYWDTVDAAEAETIEYLENKSAKENEESRLKALYVATMEGATEEELEEAGLLDEVVVEEETEEDEENAEDEEFVQDEDGDGIISIDEMSFVDAVDFIYNMKKEDGMKFKYDDVVLENPQIDVVLVDSYDKFVELVEDERVAEIDIKYDRKIITQYIHPTILSTTQVNGKTFGVPANFAMNGEYEFLVFNKNLLDKYGFVAGELDSVESERMAEFLATIKANEPGVYPISDIPEFAGAEIYDDILFAQSKLDTVSTTSFPVYLNNGGYMAYLKAVDNYKKSGYVAAHDGVNNAKYAVELVKSTTLIDREWTDENGTTYQAYLYDIPRVDANSAFSSAFCVSSQSMNKAKAAELIELFTIDSELANLLQYGIAETHYSVKDGPFRLLDVPDEDAYVMNNGFTGNQYVKYEINEGEIELAQSSNLSTAPSAFFGYTPDFKDNPGDEATYNCVKLFSAKALEKISSGEMSVDDAFNIASRQLNAIGCVWDASGANLLGVFGKLGTTQAAKAKQISANFFLAEDAKAYNDVYLTPEEIAEMEAAEEAARIAAEEAEKQAEEAALLARIEAENAANAEVEEPDPTEEDVLPESTDENAPAEDQADAE